MGHAILATVAIAGNKVAPGALNGVAKTPAACTMINTGKDEAVLAEIPAGAIVIADDGPQPKRVPVRGIAADGKGEQQPTILQAEKTGIHFSVITKAAILPVPLPADAAVS